MDLIQAAQRVEAFERGSLCEVIGDTEWALQGAGKDALCKELLERKIDHSLLSAAFAFKQVTAQVNIIVHAAGILCLLSHILRDGETIESLSLGAGRGGKSFDLETSQRIAEFKFAKWHGAPASVRLSALFKDFYILAEAESPKEKCLYVIGARHPLRFLQSGRALSAVMGRYRELWEDFNDRYAGRFSTVGEYYEFRRASVQIVDVAKMIPEFAGQFAADGEEGAR